VGRDAGGAQLPAIAQQFQDPLTPTRWRVLDLYRIGVGFPGVPNRERLRSPMSRQESSPSGNSRSATSVDRFVRPLFCCKDRVIQAVDTHPTIIAIGKKHGATYINIRAMIPSPIFFVEIIQMLRSASNSDAPKPPPMINVCDTRRTNDKIPSNANCANTPKHHQQNVVPP
jgi:hypothetical protein